MFNPLLVVEFSVTFTQSHIIDTLLPPHHCGDATFPSRLLETPTWDEPREVWTLKWARWQCCSTLSWASQSTSDILFFGGSVCACMLSCFSHVQPHGLQPARLLCPWDSPGKNTGVGCHALFQGIFRIQGSNPSLLQLLHCRRIPYHWTIREAHQ